MNQELQEIKNRMRAKSREESLARNLASKEEAKEIQSRRLEKARLIVQYLEQNFEQDILKNWCTSEIDKFAECLQRKRRFTIKVLD